MKTLSACALVLLLLANAVSASEKKKEGISVSFSSEDSRTRLAPRRIAREARLAVTTRNGAAVLMLTNDVVAVQLSNDALAGLEQNEDANFLEELLASGVKLAVGKSVEYPVANIRSAEVRNGVLVLTNDDGQPVFDNIKVNGANVARDLSAADAAKFAEAFRAVKSKR
jgi:hypothetical protein